MEAIGCRFVVKKGKMKEQNVKGKMTAVRQKDVTCSRACDAGETMCPRHKMLAATKAPETSYANG